ncbi:uncharacterized protein [Dysidea avara]|uniref:uncharacterized protein n=1 Tax=Dysidea avara TaxID=196820 RepID=UPI00331B0668
MGENHSCKANNNAAGCYSTIFGTPLSTSYSEVCGKIIGYQKGSMDSFYPSMEGLVTYVDGISITLGSPRKHLWTYAVGLSDDYEYVL